MRVLVTGGGGFVGRELVRRILDGRVDVGAAVSELVVADQKLDVERDPWLSDARVSLVEGDFADPEILDKAVAAYPALVFHLASVPGSLAERQPEVGIRINLLGSFALLLRLAAVRPQGAASPRVVFASSVAVYGALGNKVITEDWTPRPELSYGAHKLMTEVLLADLSRRGELDAISLRLPGIVARPLSPTGHGSAFMSDLFRKIGRSEAYVCPVSPQSTCWWMTLPKCVENMAHAARVAASVLPSDRVVQLPVLSASVESVVAAISKSSGGAAHVKYQPDSSTERNFGRYPNMETPRSRALGFSDDGFLESLAKDALSWEA